MTRVYVILLLFCMVSVSQAAIGDISSWCEDLSTRLYSLDTDTLGTSVIQDFLDDNAGDLFGDPIVTDGDALINQLQASMEQKFIAAIDAVEANIEKLMDLHSQTLDNGNTPECCDTSQNVYYDGRFYAEVDQEMPCVRYPPLVSADYQNEKVCELMATTMQGNMFSDPSIKWQYYGTHDGKFCNFPGKIREGEDACTNYDNRFRPWYVAATTAQKYVVIIIDTSGSMTLNDRIAKAKEAANTVLSTLGPDDYVALIHFSTEPHMPGETGWDANFPVCWSEGLVPATDANKNKLVDYVNALEEAGATNFEETFTMAYDVIQNWLDTSPITGLENVPGVILFLTDGEAECCNFDVDPWGSYEPPAVFTYILGDGVSEEYKGPLEQLSADTGGEYAEIGDDGDLRTSMGGYYTHSDLMFNQSDTLRPIFTVPYIDASGLGLVTTCAKPYYFDGVFAGVAGIDLTMADLLSDITYLRNGAFSYGFIVDRVGRVMYHPSLPDPSDVSLTQFVHILLLETSQGFLDNVYTSLLNGEEGSSNFVTERSFPRGASDDGTRLESYAATYYWKPVNQTDFSVVLVLADDDSSVEQLREVSEWPDDDFPDQLFHRVDIYHPDSLGTCAQFGSYKTKEATTYYVPPSGFINPSLYQTRDPEADEIELMNTFITEGTFAVGEEQHLRDEVRRHVLSTHLAESFWLEHSEDEVTEIVASRYVGDPYHIRTYPGNAIPPNYDPTLRGWYRLALSSPELLVVTTPYVDAFGGGIVITMAHAIYKPDGTHIQAVAGMDFVLRTFRTLVEEAAPDCTRDGDIRCFLMDSSGFLIYDDSFLTDEYVQTWVGEKFPGIGEDLLNGELLSQSVCNDYVSISVQLSHESEAGFNIEIDGTTHCGDPFIIQSVPDTNLYLLVIESTQWDDCLSNTHSEDDCACDSTDYGFCDDDDICLDPDYFTNGCSCPCVCDLGFNDCTAEFTGAIIPVCPASPTPLLSFEQQADAPSEECWANYCPDCGIFAEEVQEDDTDVAIIVVLVVVPIVLVCAVAMCVKNKLSSIRDKKPAAKPKAPNTNNQAHTLAVQPQHVQDQPHGNFPMHPVAQYPAAQPVDQYQLPYEHQAAPAVEVHYRMSVQPDPAIVPNAPPAYNPALANPVPTHAAQPHYDPPPQYI